MASLHVSMSPAGSMHILGLALKGRREDVVVISKVFSSTGPGSLGAFCCNDTQTRPIYVDIGMARYTGWRYLPSVRASYPLKNVSK